MIASVHIGDVGFPGGFLRSAPKPANVAGLRHANLGTPTPLGQAVPTLQLRRAALVAFWDDDAALDRFLADDPLAQKLANGWRVRLEPLRLHGSWPGVPDDLPRQRKVAHEGPAAVLTLGRLKYRRAPKFFRTSAKAERAALIAPGRTWSTAVVKPPFVCTCSLWESSDALSEYAYGSTNPGHPNAITTDRAKPFHHQSAFIRFRPYDSVGHLDGKNPLAEEWMTPS